MGSNRRLKSVVIEVDYFGEKRTVYSRVPRGMIHCRGLNEVIISATPFLNTRKYGTMERARWFETKRGKESMTGYLRLAEYMFNLDWSKAPVRFLSPEPSFNGRFSNSINWNINSRTAALTETPFSGIMVEQGFLCRSLKEAQLANICT